jgi:hypothetical protein
MINPQQPEPEKRADVVEDLCDRLTKEACHFRNRAGRSRECEQHIPGALFGEDAHSLRIRNPQRPTLFLMWFSQFGLPYPKPAIFGRVILWADEYIFRREKFASISLVSL